MKALLFKAPYQPVNVHDVETPIPKEGEVLVKLAAAAMNHRDNWMTKGLYPNLKSNVIPGSCGAGWVGEREVILNPNVDWGDNPNYPNHKTYTILGMPVHGTFAEYIATKEDRLVDKPAHLSLAEAAALPLAGLTAYRALFTKARATSQSKVLINGVGGGVALFAFQFAVAIGAEVYVTSGSQAKIEKALSMGAKGGVSYKEEEWHRKFKKQFGGVDVVIDSAGGKGFDFLLRVCNPQARIAVYGGTLGQSIISPQALFFREIEIYGSTMGSDQEFREMVAFVNKHQIKPIVDSIYDLSESQAAYRRMRKSKQFGKIVFKIA